jgi:hypothetical protein
MHSPRPTRRVLTATVLAGASLLSACGAGHQESSAALVSRARVSLDSTSSIHFSLTSQDVPSGGSRLVGGSGVASHTPSAFQGKLSVLIGTGTVSIDVVSVDGTVYAKLPFSDKLQKTDPGKFGLTDPAKLVQPKTGLSRLLADATQPKVVSQARIDSEVVSQMTAVVPGATVGDLLTDADPATPVQATFYITQKTGQLRRASLTGPFFEKGKTSTYVLVLNQYGQKVSISAPPHA